MRILDGKSLSLKLFDEIKIESEKIKVQRGRVPLLAAIIVGNDGASETYVGHKIKACAQVGFESKLVRLPANTTERALLLEIEKLNNNTAVDGFIVQLPLPDYISVDKVIAAINPSKDVDGFHPENIGKLAKGMPTFIPATPLGIIRLLERNLIDTRGKHCVVIGRSQIVGMPMNLLMSRDAYPGNCTVTVCHSKTVNMDKYTRDADILIVALGKPEFVTADMVKPGAVVIDVGITRLEDV